MHRAHDDAGQPRTDREADQQFRRRTRCHLFPMKTGVVAGSARRVQGDVLAMWWTFFVTREQAEIALSTDPLRFENPAQFEQLRRNFDHVFDHPSADVDPGTRAGS